MKAQTVYGQLDLWGPKPPDAADQRSEAGSSSQEEA